MISFVVYGTAKPQGSKRIGRTRAGKPIILDNSSKMRPWRDSVAYCARQAYSGPLLDGPVRMVTRYYEPRPQSHIGAKGLKPSAPIRPHRTMTGDEDKLARAIRDALSGVVYTDDKRIVSGSFDKLYGEPARVEIEISEVEN